MMIMMMTEQEVIKTFNFQRQCVYWYWYCYCYMYYVLYLFIYSDLNRFDLTPSSSSSPLSLVKISYSTFCTKYNKCIILWIMDNRYLTLYNYVFKKCTYIIIIFFKTILMYTLYSNMLLLRSKRSKIIK